MDVVSILADNPWLVVVLGILLRAGLAWQSELTYPEYRTLQGIKRLSFPVLDGRVWAKFVHHKQGREDREFVTTWPATVRTTTARLRRHGGSLHLVASLKRRPATHGDSLSIAHVVWSHDDGTQTEAYLFTNDDGTTDVYAHHETGVADPDGHLSDPQTDGDPRGVVRQALGIAAPVA